MTKLPPGSLKQPTMSDSDITKIMPSISSPSFVSQRSKKQQTTSEEELTTFREEVKLMFNELKETQSILLNKLINEVADIKQQNKEIKNSNEEIERSLEFLNFQYEEMKSKVNDLQKERKEHVTQIFYLEKKVEDLERNIKSSSIEIRNVPVIDKHESKDDLTLLVQNTCKVLKIDVPNNAIRDVYRLRAKNNKNDTIIADFSSILVKNKVILGLKSFNNDNPEQKLNSAIIGIKGQSCPIYISESLTAKGRRLFFLARELAKTQNFKYCWTSNGRVFLRKTSDTAHIEVKSENQLATIKDQN